MAEVVLFVETGCRFCEAAKEFFAQRDVAFTEVDVGGSAEAREVVRRLTGSGVVPQIFVSEVLVGSYEELRRLDESGRLDEILAAAHDPREETTLSLAI